MNILPFPDDRWIWFLALTLNVDGYMRYYTLQPFNIYYELLFCKCESVFVYFFLLCHKTICKDWCLYLEIVRRLLRVYYFFVFEHAVETARFEIKIGNNERTDFVAGPKKSIHFTLTLPNTSHIKTQTHVALLNRQADKQTDKHLTNRASLFAQSDWTQLLDGNNVITATCVDEEIVK